MKLSQFHRVTAIAVGLILNGLGSIMLLGLLGGCGPGARSPAISYTALTGVVSGSWLRFGAQVHMREKEGTTVLVSPQIAVTWPCLYTPIPAGYPRLRDQPRWDLHRTFEQPQCAWIWRSRGRNSPRH